MRIAMFSTKKYERVFFEAALPPALKCSFLEARLDHHSAVMAQGHDAVCCFVNDVLDAEVLQILASINIRMVALRCAGYNNVDLKAASALGIRVCRVPEYSPYAVAEHAVALILDLNRNIHRAFNRVRENDYSLDGLMGFDLHGKTVGVIGAGKIGRIFIRIMLGFGCRVLVFDPKPGAELDKNAELVSLPKLFSTSDIISLHCPLTPDTHHMIDAAALVQMRRGIMLINTGRGALVDTRALIAGLKTGHIGYLGLDVYEEEADLFFEDLSNTVLQDDIFARLQTFPNVTITGHQAFFTREALQAIAACTVNNLLAHADGREDAVHWVS